jgi:hypothetical protein
MHHLASKSPVSTRHVPRSCLLEPERLHTSLRVDVAFVRISVSDLILAVVIEKEVEAKMVPEACRCNGARSPIFCNAVALPGFDIAKAKDLLAVAV